MVVAVLPDSSFYIRCTRTSLDPFQEMSRKLEDYEFLTCGMVVLEVSRGLREPAILRRFKERFAVMPFVPSNRAVWERASDIAWGLDRRGVILPATDILIAACALEAKAAVLTADAHFHSVPGLRVMESLG